MLRSDEQHVERSEDREARRVLVSGTVQGVGFRPFVYRLAARLGVAGWVRNAGEGVEIHIEGAPTRLGEFVAALQREAPPSARVDRVSASSQAASGATEFEIASSAPSDRPRTQISPDLPVCDDCLAELSDPTDRRGGYPYINCTNCGPRYTIVERLPYDRANTTMSEWVMCSECAAEYGNPYDRRYHAQPTACPVCGPTFRLIAPDRSDLATGEAAIRAAALRLREGGICAVKGLGGYHLACDARNAAAVAALRERKFRKEKPFGLMVRSLDEARSLAEISVDAERLLTGAARPIVLLPAILDLDGVAPGNRELGIMLPYSPLHVLLFDAGAPAALVMTSANRSSEPIAFREDDAFERLGGLADAFLVGERPIARRVDDSVVRQGCLGPMILRRSRGYAPSAVASLPARRPILALGADLKNAVVLVVDGEAYVSQHIGDLEHFDALTAFEETARDLLRMYGVPDDDVLVAHDAHPQFASTVRAEQWGAAQIAVQHHRAHVASVLAEKGAFDEPVIGVALDGTGYGDDGSVWGGELFAGSIADGFDRIAHLYPARLPGGDAAAEHPVQAAAGFLEELQQPPDFHRPPFSFPARFAKAQMLLDRNVRTFTTTSTGRLFDTAAALLGFTRAVSFEGQAAIWLEQLATRSTSEEVYAFRGLDYRPLLQRVIVDVQEGRSRGDIARAFHLGLADGFADEARRHAESRRIRTVVLSGGVFQNQLLSRAMAERLLASGLEVWMNERVPPNDGGISLGQAALAAAAD